jgi:hypothetical protein
MNDFRGGFFTAVIYLSFWAEVHYNSIYPDGGEFHCSSLSKLKIFGHYLVYVLFSGTVTVWPLVRILPGISSILS